MEVDKVLHMTGGVGDSSYANNSLLQQKVISMTKPITVEAMTKLFCCSTTSFPTKLAIADLGCSSGPNALLVPSELIKVVNDICKKFGNNKLPEFQVFLNDLPGNDFNTLFRSFQSFPKMLREKLGPGGGAEAAGPCFFSGVPGSFYARLFPSNSLHFVYSSYSLHWLSQLPEGLEGNRGNIFMASTSPPCVLKAYYEQFQRDFSLFLKCRSEELVADGRMVITFLGRKSQDPTSKECCYIWELLAVALNDMVSEGLIEEEKLNAFNIPNYTPSPDEIKSEIMKQGSLSIDRIEVTEVNWNACHEDFNEADGFNNDGGYNLSKCMRAVAEPLLASHFGESIVDEVFRRYREILADRMSKENPKFINVTVSLAKIG